MKASAVSAFPLLPEGQKLFLEFRSTAYEFRLRVLALFLMVGVAFGLVAFLAFQTSVGGSLLLALGMCCFILAAMPRASLAYRFSGAGVEQAELTGDRLQLHSVLPLLGAAGIFTMLAFSVPVIVLAWFSLGCGLALFLARRLLPRKEGAPVRMLAWEDIVSVTLERRRGALLLRARRDEGRPGRDMVVFCPGWDIETVLGIVTAQKPALLVQEGEVIH